MPSPPEKPKTTPEISDEPAPAIAEIEQPESGAKKRARDEQRKKERARWQGKLQKAVKRCEIAPGTTATITIAAGKAPKVWLSREHGATQDCIVGEAKQLQAAGMPAATYSVP
jgi:hypothetical protein